MHTDNHQAAVSAVTKNGLNLGILAIERQLLLLMGKIPLVRLRSRSRVASVSYTCAWHSHSSSCELKVRAGSGNAASRPALSSSTLFTPCYPNFGLWGIQVPYL